MASSIRDVLGHSRGVRRGAHRPVLAIAVALCAAGCGGTSVNQLTGPEAFRCTVLLSGPGSLPATAAQTPLEVSASQSCAWSAGSDVTWLQVSPRTGNGSGSLTLVAAANNTSQERSAIVTVNEQPWAIRQAAAGAIPPIPPISSVGLSAHSTLIDPSDDR